MSSWTMGLRVLVSALLLLSVAFSVSPRKGKQGHGAVTLLDKDAEEIAKLQKEKAELIQQLSHHLNVPVQGHLSTDSFRPKVAPPARNKAVAHTKKKVPTVKALAEERLALIAAIKKYKSESRTDPLVAGILAKFQPDSGVKDSQEDVMGSLASTMTHKQKMHMLKMMAESMGDVSPKEALAQRVISMGNKLMLHDQSHAVHVQAHHHEHLLGPLPRRMRARAARGRQQQLAAGEAEEGKPAAAQEPDQAQGGAEVKVGETQKGQEGGGGVGLGIHRNEEDSKGGANLDWIQTRPDEADRRVEELEKELDKARKVAKIEAELRAAKKSLERETEKERATLQDASSKDKSDEDGDRAIVPPNPAAQRFATARRESSSFIDGSPVPDPETSVAVGGGAGCRFKGDCHAEGYVQGGIVVGDDAFTGPDRFGQGGRGPQMMKGKVGDNVIDVGIMGAAGTRDGDVLVPTGVAGVRRRDVTYGRNSAREGFGQMDAEQRDELVRGSVEHHYGHRASLGISDEAVPISDVHATEYKARTQDLADNDDVSGEIPLPPQ